MEVLIIIDMQPSHFSAAKHTSTILNCQKEIKSAIQNNSYIFFIEYELCGPTDLSLTDLTYSYENKYFITKYHDDGAPEIKNKIIELRIKNPLLKLCGVNTDACVKMTAYGLIDLGYSVNLIKKACHTDLWQYHLPSLEEMKNNNISII